MQLLLDGETQNLEPQAKALLEAQALARADQWGKTGLHYAGASENRDLAERMILCYLEKCPDLLLACDDKGCTALHSAAAYGTTATVQLLLQRARLQVWADMQSPQCRLYMWVAADKSSQYWECCALVLNLHHLHGPS